MLFTKLFIETGERRDTPFVVSALLNRKGLRCQKKKTISTIRQ